MRELGKAKFRPDLKTAAVYEWYSCFQKGLTRLKDDIWVDRPTVATDGLRTSVEYFVNITNNNNNLLSFRANRIK